VGFSLGGHYLLKYVQEKHTPHRLLGLMVLSAPFNMPKCVSAWKGNRVHEKVYDKHFLGKFKGGYERNQELFKDVPGLDHAGILAAQSMEELHKHLSAPLYGVSSVEEYQNLIRSDEKLELVQVGSPWPLSGGF
jgi:predicted alpha/beta-fold hydrolase